MESAENCGIKGSSNDCHLNLHGVVLFRLSTSAETTIAPTVATRRRSAIVKQRRLDGMPIATGDRMRLLVGPNLELVALDARYHVNLTWQARELEPTFVASQVLPATPAHGEDLAPLPAPAPSQSIPAWKGKATLRDAGLLGSVETAVQAASGRVRDAWVGASLGQCRGPLCQPRLGDSKAAEFEISRQSGDPSGDRERILPD